MNVNAEWKEVKPELGFDFISKKKCYLCKGQMTVGEDMAGGMCSDCYFKLHDEEKDEDWPQP